jgi:DNA-binding Xre family transcriptional regulator
MQVVYYKLFDLLKERGILQKDLQQKANLPSSTMGKLRHNESMTTTTIGRICDYLHVTPDKIMEWIPDDEIGKIDAERQKLEEEISELQAQLKDRQAKLKKYNR